MSNSFHNIEQIKKLFTYDPETGKVFWKRRDFGSNPSPRQKQWNTRFDGKEAGFKNGDYIRLSLVGVGHIYAHQVAFALMTGEIPVEIDHIDLDGSNNRWKNLRESPTHSDNASNCRKRSTNKSGYKGVSWGKSNNKWRMSIQYKKQWYFSYHDTKEQAYNAYCMKSAELHKEFGNVQ